MENNNKLRFKDVPIGVFIMFNDQLGVKVYDRRALIPRLGGDGLMDIDPEEEMETDND